MQGKIINDPVYGFIRLHPEIMQLVAHPYFQRLRRIKQMGLAHFVYPGAVHTRFHHSLGAMHLMSNALQILSNKGIDIPKHAILAAQKAILLHDIGHGPFSHALENTILFDTHHEEISLQLMKKMNAELNGTLEEAILIFTDQHPLAYLHQLLSGQLDMDRMDYLNRDSFYSGVSEGVIGYDRILEMLHINDGKLVVEEKGIHSVEKFLIARRLMYWQVYLHKTVLGTEQLLIKILKRARKLAQDGIDLFATPAFKYFLYDYEKDADTGSMLDLYTQLDDTDVSASIKVWQHCNDSILSNLCRMIVTRNLYKVKMSSKSLKDDYEEIIAKTEELGIYNREEIDNFIVYGTSGNDTYTKDASISVLFKNGQIKDLSEIDNALINPQIAKQVNKDFICIIPELKNLLN